MGWDLCLNTRRSNARLHIEDLTMQHERRSTQRNAGDTVARRVGNLSRPVAKDSGHKSISGSYLYLLKISSLSLVPSASEWMAELP